jgi:hypothetical protein
MGASSAVNADIDTAAACGNKRQVGEAVHRSGLDRSGDDLANPRKSPDRSYLAAPGSACTTADKRGIPE